MVTAMLVGVESHRDVELEVRRDLDAERRRRVEGHEPCGRINRPPRELLDAAQVDLHRPCDRLGDGGIAGERPPAVRYADAAVFEHAPRYHGGGFAGSGLLPDEVPIIARRGELVVPPERVVREEKTAREQRPITVVVNVTAADASSFRASQGQIAADMARAIDRASRNR
jgi:hypothetical protein